MKITSKNINIHGDSYTIFWKRDFAELCREFLERILNKITLNRGWKVTDCEILLEDDLNVSDPAAYCRDRGIDFTQLLALEVRLGEYEEVKTMYLGRIPKMTEEGTFILNGKERMVIAQLVRSPGIIFFKEKRIKKFRFHSESYDIRETVYMAELIPQRGARLEFEIHKIDPPDQLNLIMRNIPDGEREKFQNKIKDKFGQVRVRVRRNKWYHIDQLLCALGYSPPMHDDQENTSFSGSPVCNEEDCLARCQRVWEEIPKSLHIDTSEMSNVEEVKEAIQKELLQRNILSHVGRYQINRRLARLDKFLDREFQELHLCIEDIKGIVEYLNLLYHGEELPLDNKRSLSNKRIRLLGNLMAEEVVPRVLRNIEAVMRPKDTMDDQEVADLIEQAALSNDKLLKQVKEFLTTSELSRLVPDDNRLARLSLFRRITLYGPGGLVSDHIKDVRDIHWSHYGRLCPVDTPQSERLGATLSVPLEARVNEFGLLTAPYRKVIWKNQHCILREEKHLSAADEENDGPWIAYYDQRDDLLQGKMVRARRCDEEFALIEAKKVSYIDAYCLQQFSLPARMIPFLHHNDASRVLMACSALRQALPLMEKEPPLINTGYEKDISESPYPWSFGRNLLIAYMPYKGLNYEDAIVVSESASKKLTSKHTYEYAIELREYAVWKKNAKGRNSKKRIVREELSRDIFRSDIRKKKLDEKGVIRQGQWVEPGDVLVGIIDLDQKIKSSMYQLLGKAMRTGNFAIWDHSFTVPQGEEGQVTDVKIICRDEGEKQLPRGVWQLIRIKVERAREAHVGDKLTNRHGGKGVVSAVLPDEEMPYFLDYNSSHEHNLIGKHTHVEVIMNPLGVISRLNLGQLYETHLGWLAARQGKDSYPVPLFKDSWKLLERENRGLSDNVLTGGKIRLKLPPSVHEGQKGQEVKETEREVTVGYCYIMKLNHLAGDKVHGRGYPRHSYNCISEQPLQGKKKEGGQRMGEMEVWALEAYNARCILQEMLTIKSDNPAMRELLWRDSKAKPNQPEFLKVFSRYLLAAGLKMEFLNNKGQEIDIFKSLFLLSPDKVASVSIRPTTDNEIRELSSGEVTDPFMGMEREGYEDNGLFSQTIFGPLVDGMCKCGTLVVSNDGEGGCRKCKIENVQSQVRRTRIGHIELDYPVFNVVFMEVAATLLGLSSEIFKSFLVERPVLRFTEQLDSFLFLSLLLKSSGEFHDRFNKKLRKEKPKLKQEKLLTMGNDSQTDVNKLRECFSSIKDLNFLNELMTEVIAEGTSSISLLNDLLQGLNESRLRDIRGHLLKELHSLIEEGKKPSRQRQICQRLEIIDCFLHSHISPDQMMLNVLPVLPPDLRPPFETSKKQVVWNELNLLYQHILQFKRQLQKGKARKEDFRKNIKELQRRVSAVIDNNKAWPSSTLSNGTQIEQCLAYYLRGKNGFFRANLLGKRVDYSGRGVIIPDPNLTLDECGLPYAMMVKLFEPLLWPRLSDEWQNVRPLSHKAVMERIKKSMGSIGKLGKDKEAMKDREKVMELLNEIGSKNPVLLNRQPTLHRLGIQTFYPKVNNHNAVSMHPLVTAGYNADFDGDTIAVHRVVTPKAKEETDNLMASANLFSPANGSLTLNLGQDVALGMFLQTMTPAGRDALKRITGISFGNRPIDRKALAQHLYKFMRMVSDKARQELVEHIKEMAFERATSSGVTLSIFDLPDLSNRRDAVMNIFMTRPEAATAEMENKVKISLRESPKSSVSLIIESGARGSYSTVNQLVGMRGPMERITDVVEGAPAPVVWSSLKEGMKLGEYFASSYGSRTSLVDKKFGTAEAGYVSRKLVEIAHPLRITAETCTRSNGKVNGKAFEGIWIGPYRYEWLDLKDWPMPSLLEKLKEQYIESIVWDKSNINKSNLCFEQVGRAFSNEIRERISRWNPQIRFRGVKVRYERSRDELCSKLFGRVLIDAEEGNEEVIADPHRAGQYADTMLKNKSSLLIRSPLTCKMRKGICQRCYGLDQVSRMFPDIGAKVGIIAAQSIGEPGTQMALRTFHHGGILGMAGITEDIQKVDRFISCNALAESEMDLRKITDKEKDANFRPLPKKYFPLLIDGIKSIYSANGSDISDQHFEVIVKGMSGKVEVGARYNSFYPSKVLEKSEVIDEAGEDLQIIQLLSGIRMLIKHSSSWLSASSFGGDTLSVLGRAAVGHRIDNLMGLKENVILGKLLPNNKENEI
ncbi:MAG: hypothetical protein ACMUJM_02915 [bacterium]